MCNSCEVLIWEPKNKFKKLTLQEFGHAALQTETYHMSLWPDTPKKNSSFDINEEVNGCLHFHHDYDAFNIYDKDEIKSSLPPVQINLNFISSSKINSAYEDMLAYNDITPDNVTLTNGEKIWGHRIKCTKTHKEDRSPKEEEQFCPTKQKHVPKVSLRKSKWCFSSNFHKDDFYKYPQSCTGFCLGLLNLASDGGVDKFITDYAHSFAYVSAFTAGSPEAEDIGLFESSILLNQGNGWLNMDVFKSIIYDIKNNRPRNRNNGNQDNGCLLF